MMARNILCLLAVTLFCSACQGNTIAGRAARFGDDNRYFVYTRDDHRNNNIRLEPTVASANQIRVLREKTVILIHDVQGSFLSPLNPILRDALLTAEDVSIIVVDWSLVAMRENAFIVQTAPDLGENIANLIRVLVNARKVSLANLHLVGFGVGAHIAAFAARAITTGKVARITALDPAGDKLLWTSNSGRLQASDANYVEVIHTDSGATGIPDPIGHVDFFPNGGLDQATAGCQNAQCHHDRAWELFAASLTHGGLEGNKCSGNPPSEANCKGYVLSLGTNQPIKFGDGSYFLETSDTYPYNV